MRIGELSRRSKVPATTIRYYEDLGLLPAPRRVSGRRDYAEGDVELLLAIRGLQLAGFKLTEIRDVVQGWSRGEGTIEGWRDVAGAKLAEIDRSIDELIKTRALLARAIDCRCDRGAEACVLLEAAR